MNPLCGDSWVFGATLWRTYEFLATRVLGCWGRLFVAFASSRGSIGQLGSDMALWFCVGEAFGDPSRAMEAYVPNRGVGSVMGFVH